MEVDIEKLCSLPVGKRLDIMAALWESVERDVGPVAIFPDFADELDRRHAEHVADPSSSIPWETVRAEMRRAYLEPIPREIIDEADCEFEAHLADPGSSIPWEEVYARLLEKYGRDS